jgi:hypothetical protein
MDLKIHELKQIALFLAEDPLFYLSEINSFETFRKKFG